MRKGLTGKGRATIVSTRSGDMCQLHIRLPARIYNGLYNMAKENDALVTTLVRDCIERMVIEYQIYQKTNK